MHPTLEHPNILTVKKAETDKNTIIVEDFTIPLLTMNRPYRQKINKETLDSNYTSGQMDLTDICRIFHPKTADYTFF